MATNNDSLIDPKDQRLQDVKAEGEGILSDYETGMNNAIASNTNTMNDALDHIGVDKDGNVKEGSATDKLIDVQNANTDFAIEQIEQQKDKAQKDYTKEQAGAYVDWQKQSNQYGVNAEQMAASGLQNSGYSESSQVSMYTTYQNRVAVARESYNQIVQDFNNQITQARLQNNSALAEIIANAMAQRLQIVTEFGVKNTELLMQKTQGIATIKNQNQSNYLSVYNQLLNEKQLEEQKRQHNETLAFQREQFEWQKDQANKKSSAISTGGGSKKSSSGSKKSGNGSTSTKKITSTGTVKNSARDQVDNSDGMPTVDMNSVLALGYGPISASKLNSLIEKGLVKEYEKDGKLKYKKVVGGKLGNIGGRYDGLR